MKKVVKYLSIIICTFIISISYVKAASYDVSVTSNTVTVGNSITLTIKGNDLAGKFTLSSSNSGVASLSGSSLWIDNNSQSVTISTSNAGTAVITITPTDVTSYDGKTITGNKTVTITVNSKPTSNPNNGGNKTGTTTTPKPTKKKSSNNNLSSLTIEGYNLDKEFKKEVKKEAKPVREPKKETAAKPQTENKEVKPVAKEAQPKPEPRKPVVRTEEQVQQMKQDAEKFLTGVFGAMELPVEITMNYDKTADCLEIDFAGEDMGILIGKRGQTLDSLQYLTSLVVNKEQQDYVRVKVDTENYRSRRKDTLENLAKNIAFKVRKTRKPVVLEPMNPYERRIIHSALQGNKYVETYSEGNEPYRHVVVVYKGK